MKNKGRRYRAFTIMELAIAMVISAIVVGFCYYAWLFVRRQTITYQARSRLVNEYYLLSTALQRDAERADAIKDELDKGHVEFIHEGGAAGYLFNRLSVMRGTADVQDTFRIKAAIDSVRYVNDSLHLIEKIFLHVEMDTVEMHFFINKVYSAGQIMKAEEEQHEQIN
jgi:type II secretory pathway component PulJ